MSVLKKVNVRRLEMTHIKESMKEKAKEFTAYEIEYATGKKTDLTLLPEPIYVYVEDNIWIELGAMFAFTMGTNPEVLIVFECIRGKVSFNCEILRVGGEEMHVAWKGREIWKSDRGNGQPRTKIPTAYISFPYSDLEKGIL
ncbi:MAG: hypothetical protein QG641_1887 [Candidatus Poribacteria bacterium]|nr:hypothetical protein [Candidatus Poribacteria bacterium]